MTGSGTLLDPYVIWDVTDLQNMSLDLAAYYELGSDIDASATVGWNAGAGFLPVGNAGARFTGHFDGKNFSISDLHINRPATDYIGLWGCTDEASISNVTLSCTVHGLNNTGGLIGYAYGTSVSNCSTSGSVTTDHNDTGGLIGNSNDSAGGTRCTISNCHSSCTVAGVDAGVFGSNEIGGLVGISYYTDYTDCYADGNVTGTSDRVAGFIGQAYYCTMNRCYGIGTITGTGNAAGATSSYTAGLIGQSFFNTLTDCYATGDVTGQGYIGGLIGQGASTTFTDCHASGTIQNSVGQHAGGFIAQSSNNTFTNCYSTGNLTSDQRYAGGFASQVLGSDTFTDCYETGSVTLTGLGLNGSYAGGFYGTSNATGSYTRCYATGNVSAVDYAGGFAGWGRGVLLQCFATGNVTGEDRLGGFTGWGSHDSYTNCYARGSVTGIDRVGGFIGDMSGTTTITNCYSSGAVSGTTNVGGFAGSNGGTITHCFWDINTSGQSTSAGGYGEVTTRMQDIDTFLAAGWNMEEHGSVDMADRYPFLSWQVPGSSPVWFIFAPPGPPPPVPSVITLPATEIH